jgi:hypothetical protein
MSDNFAWVFICILDVGHFSFLHVDEYARKIGLALSSFFFSFFNLLYFLKNTLARKAMLIGWSTVNLVQRFCGVSITSLIVNVRVSIK